MDALYLAGIAGLAVLLYLLILACDRLGARK
ncbi:MAG: hypothetical protein JWN23_2532 [Rhodocyclales bacterium]|nr:hypothetical protein [Rhodocyclales bacterium]